MINENLSNSLMLDGQTELVSVDITTAKPNAFTIVTLGTGTSFTPKPTSTTIDYPKGETLSLFATLLPGNPTNESLPKEVQYQTVTGHVIEGPDNMGSYVANRIRVALESAFKAISQGHRTINLAGHSRGAVEAIILSHYLQELKTIAPNCHSIQELITELTKLENKRVNTTNFGPEFKELIKFLNKADENPNFFKSFQTHIAETRVNYFGIDPVPGDPGLGISWIDDRYLSLPPIVQNAEIYYYINEKTKNGFTPVLVTAQDSDSTFLNTYPLPGNHSTGSSGNNCYQGTVPLNNKNVKEIKSKIKTDETTLTEKTTKDPLLTMTDVQKLLFVKLTNFSTRNQAKIDLGELINSKQYPRALGKTTVEKHEGNHNDVIIELYDKILKNKEGYNLLNKGNYTLLGNIDLKSRIMIKGIDKDNNLNRELLLEDHFKIKEFTHYVNDEHRELKYTVLNDLIRTYIQSNSNSPSQDPDDLNKLIANLKAFYQEVLPSIQSSKEEDYKTKVTSISQETIKYLVERYLELDVNRPVEKDAKIAQKQKEEMFARVRDLFDTLKNHENKFAQEVFLDQAMKQLNALINKQHEDVIQYINTIKTYQNNELINKFFEDEKIDASLLDDEEYKKLTDNHEKLIWVCNKHEEINQSKFIDKFYDNYQEDILARYKIAYYQIHNLKEDVEAVDRYNLDILEKNGRHIARALNELSNEVVKLASDVFVKKPDITNTALQNDFLTMALRHAVDNKKMEDPIKQLQKKIDLEKQANQLLKDQIEQQKKEMELINTKEHADKVLLIYQLNFLIKQYETHLKSVHGDTPKTADKLDVLKQLKETISDKSNKCLEDQITDFYNKLDEQKDRLEIHQNTMAKRFWLTVLLVGAILATGIIPGLILFGAGLYIYSKTNPDRSIGFWKTQGSYVVEQLEDLEPEWLESDNETNSI